MGILQQASGQFNGNGSFNVALPAASSPSSTVVVLIAGNTVVPTPSGWTLRTSQVNFMGHYLWDRAGGGTSYPFTANGQGVWWVAELSGAYDTTQSANNTAGATTYASPSLTPGAGDKTLLASFGSVQPGSSRTATFNNSFVEQLDTFVATADYPSHAVASREATGGTAYTTTATWSTNVLGRSAIIAAYQSPTTAAPPAYEWDANLTVDVTLSGVLAPYFTWVAATAPDAVLTAGMVPAFGWDAPFTVDAVLSGGMAPSFAWETTATLDVTITADTMPHFSWSASFGVDVALSSETSSDRAWSATFTPDVELTAEAAPHFTWDANLTADVGLEATTVPAFTWDAVFTPDVDLTATLTRARSWYHIFTADVNLAATTRPHFAWTSTATIEVSLTDQPQEPNMSVPSPDWGLVLMKWAGVYLDGTPCTGRIKVSFNKPATLDAKAPMLDDDPETPLSIYVAATIDVQLTTKTVLYGGSPRPVGYAEFWVPATDDPDITDSAGNPLAGGTYTCTEALGRGAGQTPFKFVAPIATSPDGLWLNKIEHVA